MNAPMIFAGLMLGLASGGHCIAMCGAGSAWAIGSQQGGQSGASERARRLLSFHAGRISGYALVGVALGGAAAAFHALTEWVSVLRPLWTMINTVFFLFGATLLITARQPRLLDAAGQKFGKWFRAATSQTAQPQVFSLVFHANAQGAGASITPSAARATRRGLVTGLGWAFIPCGPLYSAWTLALFAGDALSGALTAMAFAVASGAQLAFAQWWLARRAPKSGWQGGRWDKVGIRLAGAALCFSAGYSITMMVAGGKSDGLFCL